MSILSCCLLFPLHLWQSIPRLLVSTVSYENQLHCRLVPLYLWQSTPLSMFDCLFSTVAPVAIHSTIDVRPSTFSTVAPVTIDSTFDVRLYILSTVSTVTIDSTQWLSPSIYSTGYSFHWSTCDNRLHLQCSTVYFSTVVPVTIDSTVNVQLSNVSTVLPETIDSTIDGRQSDATAVSLNKQTADEILSPKLRARSQFRENAWCPPDRPGVGLMNGFSIKAVECVAGGGRAEKLFHYYCTRPSLKWTVAIALWLIRHCHRYLGEYIISKCWSEMS